MGDYEKFKTKVYQLTKIDLSCYKERQMKRRIDSLISKRKISSYDEYINAISKDKELLEEFVAYLTINGRIVFRNLFKSKTITEALNGENRAYNTVFCVGLC